MTGMIPRPPDDVPDAAEQDAGHVQAAAHLRQQHPGWVIIWSAPLRRYTATPLFQAPRGTHLTATTPSELAAQMDQVEQPARHPRSRSWHLDT